MGTTKSFRLHSMETSLIISQALKESIDCPTLHQELLLLLKPLENKPIEDLLDIGRDESLEEIDRKIHMVFDQARHKAQQNSDMADFVQIINVAKKCLCDGVRQADIRSVLISIWLNCYLNIKTTDLIGVSDVMAIEKVCGVITTILSKISIGISTSSDAPFHEKEMLKKAEEGFANNNIDDVYSFVTALERSSRGPLYKPMLLRLIKLLHDLDFDVFIKHLTTLNSIFPIVFYLQWMYSSVEFLRIANEPSLTNKWLNFELIRQLVAKDDLKAMQDEGVTAICNALSRIKETDFEFFKQAIKYFHRSRPLNIEIFDTALGKFLSSCNSTEMSLIVEEAFEINRYESNIKSRDALMASYHKNSDATVYIQFLQAIFNLWRRFWGEICRDKEFYATELIYTDYANFVVEYHSLTAPDNDLVGMIKALLDKIRYIDAEWGNSKSNQQTKFYLYLTELLLLSYAYRNKGIMDVEILSCVRTTLNNPIMEMRYNVSDSKDYRNEIIQNIDWEHQS